MGLTNLLEVTVLNVDFKFASYLRKSVIKIGKVIIITMTIPPEAWDSYPNRWQVTLEELGLPPIVNDSEAMCAFINPTFNINFGYLQILEKHLTIQKVQNSTSGSAPTVYLTYISA